jgi:Tfp pilus assembly PilM family ATPase
LELGRGHDKIFDASMAKQCIGLDIGSSAVKAVQLKKKGTGWALQAFGMQPLVPQTIVDGTIMDQGAVSEAVRQLWSRLKLKTKDVAIAIAGHSVIIKKITVPMMKADELAANIRNEAEHHIPFGRDDVEIDYHVTNPMTASGQTELLLVAAKKEVVSDSSRSCAMRVCRRRLSMLPRSRARTASRRTIRSTRARPSCSSTSAPRSRTSTSCAAASRSSRAT